MTTAVRVEWFDLPTRPVNGTVFVRQEENVADVDRIREWAAGAVGAGFSAAAAGLVSAGEAARSAASAFESLAEALDTARGDVDDDDE